MEERMPTANRRRLGTTIALLLLAAGLQLSGIALAQDGDAVSEGIMANYDLSWWTVDAGGHTWSSDGSYSLGGTIGQPDAGDLTGESDPPARLYVLAGGYWEGGAVVEVMHKVYLPIVLRSHRP